MSSELASAPSARVHLVRPLQLLALLALYAIFYQLGRASGPLSWQQRCTCPEAARTLSIREGLSPDEVKGIADCVLHDQPTRGRLHGRLARCIGRSAWQTPGRPSSSGGGGSKQQQQQLGGRQQRDG